MRALFRCIVCVSALAAFSNVNAQDTLRVDQIIAALGRPSPDSVMLRWAPLNFNVWRAGNTNGYDIERYVMVRNGNILDVPEKTVLNSIPVKVVDEANWEPLVTRNKYAAIAAQALFGDRFEIDLGQSSVIDIVNKVRENEQRFAFSLFSADMSVEVAKAMGLLYVDRKTNKGEKYLYRIVVHGIDSLRGSVFISPEDEYKLFPPAELKAKVNNGLVELQWNKSHLYYYTAYQLERSDDGKNFGILKDALITVTPTETANSRYEMAVDSLPSADRTYYYRVRGITPFGEVGPPSDTASATGGLVLDDVPYITTGVNVDNRSTRITWEFPGGTNALKGFSVERSFTGSQNFDPITKGLLPPDARTYDDKSPGQVNYYRVGAHAANGQVLYSAPYFVQLIDSVPPSMPTGLKAFVDETGILKLSWQSGKEQDLYGYRIYRSNTKAEEPFLVTGEPLRDSLYTDRVDLNTLNRYIYYRVMAVDRNQNQSPLSEMLEVALPDKVRPTSPVFLPVQADETGVLLQWQRSSSEDVVEYDVYRKTAGTDQWTRLKVIPANQDTVYEFKDTNTTAGHQNNYTVTALDAAGLESEPAIPVRAGKISNSLRPPVQWMQSAINREKNEVTLTWRYDHTNIGQYRIYKEFDGNEPVLFRSLPGDRRELVDKLTPGKRNVYTIMAVFQDGRMSELSNEIEIVY